MPRKPTVLALARTIGGYYHGQLLAGLVRQVTAASGRVVVAQTLEPGTDGIDSPTAPDYRLPVAWETHEQADELRAMGCTTAQGWLYAKALPADDAGDILGTRLSEHEAAVPSGAGGPSLSR